MRHSAWSGGESSNGDPRDCCRGIRDRSSGRLDRTTRTAHPLHGRRASQVGSSTASYLAGNVTVWAVLALCDHSGRQHPAISRRDDRSLRRSHSSGPSHGQENEYFGWTDARSATARPLAQLFVQRFPQIVERSVGEDWLYASWYVQMLGVAESGYLPVAYSD